MTSTSTSTCFRELNPDRSTRRRLVTLWSELAPCRAACVSFFFVVVVGNSNCNFNFNFNLNFNFFFLISMSLADRKLGQPLIHCANHSWAAIVAAGRGLAALALVVVSELVELIASPSHLP